MAHPARTDGPPPWVHGRRWARGAAGPDGVERGWGPPPWMRGRWPRVPVVVGLALIQVFEDIGAAHAQPERRPLQPLSLLLLAGPACLLALTTARRIPAVAVAVGAVTAAYLAVGYPYGPVFATLVVVVVVCVASGHRVTAWLVTAGVLAVDFVANAVLPQRDWHWVAEAALVTWALLFLALAEVVRVRRERALQFHAVVTERRRREAGEERLRIAQELHDVVAHHMSLINVQASVALHIGEQRPDQAQEALRVIKGASKEALTELRSLIGVLRQDADPAPRAPAASLASLDALAERARYAGLGVTTDVTGSVRPLPAAVELAAYRILQEAVTNVVRHARAQRLEVGVDYGTDLLTVRVDDDGTGGEVGPLAHEGTGVSGMRERVGAFGGTLELVRSPLGGVRVLATIPTGPVQHERRTPGEEAP